MCFKEQQKTILESAVTILCDILRNKSYSQNIYRYEQFLQNYGFKFLFYLTRVRNRLPANLLAQVELTVKDVTFVLEQKQQCQDTMGDFLKLENDAVTTQKQDDWKFAILETITYFEAVEGALLREMLSVPKCSYPFHGLSKLIDTTLVKWLKIGLSDGLLNHKMECIYFLTAVVKVSTLFGKLDVPAGGNECIWKVIFEKLKYYLYFLNTAKSEVNAKTALETSLNILYCLHLLRQQCNDIFQINHAILHKINCAYSSKKEQMFIKRTQKVPTYRVAFMYLGWIWYASCFTELPDDISPCILQPPSKRHCRLKLILPGVSAQSSVETSSSSVSKRRRTSSAISTTPSTSTSTSTSTTTPAPLQPKRKPNRFPITAPLQPAISHGVVLSQLEEQSYPSLLSVTSSAVSPSYNVDAPFEEVVLTAQNLVESASPDSSSSKSESVELFETVPSSPLPTVLLSTPSTPSPSNLYLMNASLENQESLHSAFLTSNHGQSGQNVMMNPSSDMFLFASFMAQTLQTGMENISNVLSTTMKDCSTSLRNHEVRLDHYDVRLAALEKHLQLSATTSRDRDVAVATTLLSIGSCT